MGNSRSFEDVLDYLFTECEKKAEKCYNDLTQNHEAFEVRENNGIGVAAQKEIEASYPEFHCEDCMHF